MTPQTININGLHLTDDWVRFAICAHCGKTSHEVPLFLYVSEELIKFACIHCYHEAMHG
tara:strand:- start:5739 stop:5915 length:177 start_codon:yes stop_codon:yes gene_type:complete